MANALDGVNARGVRSRMVEDHTLLALCLDALERLEVDVRSEPLAESPIGAGGLCVVHGRPTLILDPRAPVRDQIDACVRAIQALPNEEIFLHPAVRVLVDG